MTDKEYFEISTISYFNPEINSFGRLNSVIKGYIFYFEKNSDPALNSYISQNYEYLKQEFRKAGMTFVYLPFVAKNTTSNKIKDVVDYYVPRLSQQVGSELEDVFRQEFICNDSFGIFTHDSDSDKPILEYNYDSVLKVVGYSGNANQGFIYLGSEGNYLFEIQDEVQDCKDYLNRFVDYLQESFRESDIIDYDSMIGISIIDYTEQLDDEAKAIVSEMATKLSALKDSGQLLFLVPILKDMLDKQAAELKLEQVNKMVINEERRILLPVFQKEVELSHLTKAVYFLFLKHQNGIYLKDLHFYRRELMELYLNISNQLDLDKMNKSIGDLVNLETKAIYTHLSRIKSAFYKIMDESHASYYIISGRRDGNRRILLDTRSIQWSQNDSIQISDGDEDDIWIDLGEEF